MYTFSGGEGRGVGPRAQVPIGHILQWVGQCEVCMAVGRVHRAVWPCTDPPTITEARPTSSIDVLRGVGLRLALIEGLGGGIATVSTLGSILYGCGAGHGSLRACMQFRACGST